MLNNSLGYSILLDVFVYYILKYTKLWFERTPDLTRITYCSPLGSFAAFSREPLQSGNGRY